MLPVRYVLSFPDPHTHYAEINATVPSEGAADVEMMMAVWTPGSYLVREFSRHVSVKLAATARDSTCIRRSRRSESFLRRHAAKSSAI